MTEQANELRQGGEGHRRSTPAICLASLLLLLSLLPETGCRAQQPWPLWDAYTQHFIDAQGRVIDRSAGDRTTSEGQAYAMFFALVDNDRSRFERLLAWTEANLAGGDLTLHLPGWDWGRAATGEWKLRDANSASDADLWLAYSLLEAGRLWHDPRYDKLGRLVAERIASTEVVLVPDVGTELAPGPNGFHTAEREPDRPAAEPADRWILNPSYTPLPLLVRLSKALPNGPWATLAADLPAITGGAVSHGYAMDWVTAGPGGVRPSTPPTEPTSGRREGQAAGSYDAIRVYLWLGMADVGTPGVKPMRASVSGMAGYLRSGASTPPLAVGADGSVLAAEAPVGFSAAVIPYLQMEGMRAQAVQQSDRLTATRDPATGLYGRSQSYYDQNLVLFSTGWSEQRFRFEPNGELRVRWK